MNDELFQENIRLVNAIVNRMNYGYVEKEDLLQAGLMGLFQATKRYNENYNTAFSTFATPYIIGEIKKELRENKLIKLSKEMIRIIKKIKNDEEMTVESAAVACHTSKENILLALSYKESSYSLNEKNDELELIDLVAEPERKTNFIEVIDELEPKSKEIILMKYFQGLSQQEIASKINFSQSKVSRIEKSAIKKMREILRVRI